MLGGGSSLGLQRASGVPEEDGFIGLTRDESIAALHR